MPRSSARGVKHDAYLRQNSCLNFFTVNPKQVKWSADVFPFSHALERVTLNLCADPPGYVQRFAQASH